MSTTIPVGMWVASASTADRGDVELDHCAGHPTGQGDRDVDGDLLAGPDDHQVDVLEHLLDRVALDGLGQGQELCVVEAHLQQDVGRLEREHQLVTGERDVGRVGAVAVDDPGDLAGAADPARCALAELGARLGVDTDLGHGGTLLLSVLQGSLCFGACAASGAVLLRGNGW